ncbi:MAG: hypothetical protein ACRDSE_20990, partial [Pseudonocardiaceae bacterium]
TSFMLAALRVLHVDTSHAPAQSAAIEGKAPLMAYQLAEQAFLMADRLTSEAHAGIAVPDDDARRTADSAAFLAATPTATVIPLRPVASG